MSIITFVGKPAKHGDYFIFHIPNKLIKSQLIDPKETYQLSLDLINPANSKEKEQKSATQTS